MNEKVKKSLPLIVFLSTILIGLFSLFVSYRVSGILPGEMFPGGPYGGGATTPPGGWPQGTAVPNTGTPPPGTSYNADECAPAQSLQEPVEPKPLPFWKKILNSIFNLLGLTKRGAEMFPTQQGAGGCWWTWDENKGIWFPSDVSGAPLPGTTCTPPYTCYTTCTPPYTQPSYPTGLAATGNCAGSWNCWPSETTWKAAFCDLHPDQCQNGTQPPDWAYNDVADAVNFVEINGRGPTDQEWIDRWHTGHTWGTYNGSCPPGFEYTGGTTCTLLGFQSGASNGNCPDGCAMTQGPASATDPTGLTCDCPTNGTCGGNGGRGYFTDPDCPCDDTDPSTVCGEGGGDDTTGDDDDTTPTTSFECTGLGPEPTSSPQPGDQLTFTCSSSVSNITINHYNFRVNQGTPTRVDTTASQATFDYTVPETGGPFTIQCQVCTSSDDTNCTTWGQAH